MRYRAKRIINKTGLITAKDIRVPKNDVHRDEEGNYAFFQSGMAIGSEASGARVRVRPSIRPANTGYMDGVMCAP